MQYVTIVAVDKLGPSVPRCRCADRPSRDAVAVAGTGRAAAGAGLPAPGVDDKRDSSVETVLLAEHLKGKAPR